MGTHFNTVNQWLRDSLERADFSARALSRQLDIDPCQVSRWLNEREKVPRYHVFEIATILSPREVEYAFHLKDCEEQEEQLSEIAFDFSAEDQGLTDFVLSRMHRKLGSALDQELDATPRHHARLGVRFLSAAKFALRSAILLREHPDEEFVSALNIQRHIQYPYNHFVGLLLEMGQDQDCLAQRRPILLDFREGALRSLRRTAFPSGSRSFELEMFVEHHSCHLLARHGDQRDRERVARQLTRDQGSRSPMERRLILAGLSLAGYSDFSAQYVDELRASEQLRSANITFDAVHYGDLLLSDVGRSSLPMDPPKRASEHVLRHIAN